MRPARPDLPPPDREPYPAVVSGERLRDRSYAAVVDAGSWLLRLVERFIVRFSRVETSPFLAVEQFAWA